MLVSPYLFIGVYGITLVEVLVVIAFFTFAGAELLKGSIRLPKFLLIYLTLYGFGWAGALLNGPNWDMPVGLWNLNFFYKIVLVIGSYYIGFHLYRSMDTIVTHKFFRVVIIALAIFVALYPFLTYEQRFAILKVFSASGEDGILRLNSPRFPGLGINANVYSFMVFSFLVFSFDAYMRKLVPAILPLLIFIVILGAASKLVMGLSVVAFSVLLLNKLLSYRSRGVFGQGAGRKVVINKRALSIAALISVFIFGIFIFISRTSTGEFIREGLVVIDRLEDISEKTGEDSALQGRFGAWERGLERVKLAPVLGIIRDPYVQDDFNPLYFNAPHNEFIVFWTSYGILGLLAHLFLLVYLLMYNLARKAVLPWIIFYPALAVFMLFDGVLDGTRSLVMFFMLVGLNVRYLQLRDQAVNSDCWLGQEFETLKYVK